MTQENDSTAEKVAKVAGSAAAGAAVGYGAIAATGLTAAGMVGGGAGIGAAAGPVGATIGAITGLAAYGLYRLFADGDDAPSDNQLQKIEALKEAHAKGFLSDADLERELRNAVNPQSE
ncbi:MAG: hypothetical protein QG599_3335 [Pseudomonadota bacterium]|nr:hypothetical protein [Pseudomonadota bacterium]